MEEKLIHVKPGMYALFYENLKAIAKEYGYNIVLHGSMSRDLDLIAIPWVDDPMPELEMIWAFDEYLTGKHTVTPSGDPALAYMFNILPGGRRSYVICLNRGDRKGEWTGYDSQYYLDISVTPIINKSK
jgi:hypothetical protein